MQYQKKLTSEQMDIAIALIDAITENDIWFFATGVMQAVKERTLPETNEITRGQTIAQLIAQDDEWWTNPTIIRKFVSSTAGILTKLKVQEGGIDPANNASFQQMIQLVSMTNVKEENVVQRIILESTRLTPATVIN